MSNYQWLKQKNSSNPQQDMIRTKSNGGEVVELVGGQTATSVMNKETIQQSSHFWPRHCVFAHERLTILHNHGCTLYN